jgi:hypothetical protein
MQSVARLVMLRGAPQTASVKLQFSSGLITDRAKSDPRHRGLCPLTALLASSNGAQHLKVWADFVEKRLLDCRPIG